MSTKDEDAVTRVFSASTHTPMLFFSSGGKVYKLKVWRLPIGRADLARQGLRQPAARSSPARRITSILPLPEDEATWERHGRDVRHPLGRRAAQQALATSSQVNRNGKIAMKLDEGDSIVGVALCQRQPTTCC